jgi:clathrin heavy chain
MDFPIDPNFPNDFPVYMQVSGKYGILYAATKAGFLYGFELTTASPLFRVRISEQSIFIGARNAKTDGILTINKAGAVIANDIDPANYIPHILRSTHIPDNSTLGFKLAVRFKLPGVENLLVEQFN